MDIVERRTETTEYVDVLISKEESVSFSRAFRHLEPIHIKELNGLFAIREISFYDDGTNDDKSKLQAYITLRLVNDD